jgi:hypothetical protein
LAFGIFQRKHETVLFVRTLRVAFEIALYATHCGEARFAVLVFANKYSVMAKRAFIQNAAIYAIHNYITVNTAILQIGDYVV